MAKISTKEEIVDIYLSGVGKHRLAILLWQVCATLSGNRTYISQCIRLCYRSVSSSSLVVYCNVAFFAYNQRFTPFRNHNNFPCLFALEIFELIYMVNFITIALGRTA